MMMVAELGGDENLPARNTAFAARHTKNSETFLNSLTIDSRVDCEIKTRYNFDKAKLYSTIKYLLAYDPKKQLKAI